MRTALRALDEICPGRQRCQFPRDAVHRNDSYLPCDHRTVHGQSEIVWKERIGHSAALCEGGAVSFWGMHMKKVLAVLLVTALTLGLP